MVHCSLTAELGVRGPVVLGDRYATLAGAEAWAVFLFASYLLGHLVFLLSSSLDGIYDWLRDRTLNWQIRHIASRGRVLSWPIRTCVWLVFKRERNLAVSRAVQIKESALAPLQAKDAINAFQWCKALLNIESPQSLAVVQRFEADSKFFRCFTVVLLLLLATWPWQHHWPLAGIAVVLGLFLLALWRYTPQPFKATNQAYWSVITLTAQGGRVTLDKPTHNRPLCRTPTSQHVSRPEHTETLDRCICIRDQANSRSMLTPHHSSISNCGSLISIFVIATPFITFLLRNKIPPSLSIKVLPNNLFPSTKHFTILPTNLSTVLMA
jgi:hypothetical protein